jgi:hypothetical protein
MADGVEAVHKVKRGGERRGGQVGARLAGSTSAIRRPGADVRIRTAEHDGRLYLELAGAHWRALDTGPDGWRGLGSPPVASAAPPECLPLPVPERVGSIEILWSSSIFRAGTTLP